VELEKVSSDIDRLWTKLRSVTPARIGLARSGSSVETRLLLDFQLAHAEAQDAVKDRIDADRLISDLIARPGHGLPIKQSARSEDVPRAARLRSRVE
jgi:ethanolamine ammonia-lyase small subunit